MGVLTKGTNFSSTEQVTAAKLNNLVDTATFTSDADTCNSAGGLELDDSGKLQIKDDAVNLAKLSNENTLKKLYPIGSIYINATNSTNPGTLMGFGTWESFGAGRVLLGVGSGTDAGSTSQTFAIETDGAVNTANGRYSVQLTAAESGVPAHAHKFKITGDSTPDSGTTGGIMVSGTGATVNGVTGTPSDTEGEQIGGNTAAGAASAHENKQPYWVVYMWKRTA